MPGSADKKPEIVVRFAPSPTGFLHVGGARTALFNYLFARQHGGTFIVRIEDTDKERSKKEYADDILAGLKWLSLSYDEMHEQSKRADCHEHYLQKLLKDGRAYEGEENETGTGNVIRFKNPETTVEFYDMIRGAVKIDTKELGDFVIAKNAKTPLFHFAGAVDDFEMGITHVIRGEDHISNTQRQILIQRALGAPEPRYAHLPLILAPDRTKLSKRHGAVSVSEYEREGYLPGALLNFLALLGWNPGTSQEVFGLDELVKHFDIGKVQKGGAVFNTEKLKWLNKEYIKKLPAEEMNACALRFLPERVKAIPGYAEEAFIKALPTLMERVQTFGELRIAGEAGEYDYFFTAPEYKTELLPWKKDKPEATRKYLERSAEILSRADFSSVDNIKGELVKYAEEQGKGSVLWPVRVALSGRERSPDPFVLAFLLGRDETLKRLALAARLLE